MRKLLSLLTVGIAVVAASTAIADPGEASDTVLLPTGDEVVLRTAPDGRELVEVRPAAAKGVAATLVHLRLGGRAFEVPATALPYLGRGLNLADFDIHARPKVTDGQAAKEFGKALAKQYAEDRARGSFGGQGLFAGKAPKRVAVRSPMRTVSLDAQGPDGKPANEGVAFLYNVDNAGLLDFDEQVNYFEGGTAKFSAPDGHYSALGLFISTDADNNVTGVRFVSHPEFAVDADTTVRVDAPRATSKVDWVTPRPSLLADNGFYLRRAAKVGTSQVVDVSAGPAPIWVAPSARPVRVGELQTYPHTRLISAPAPGVPYEYQLQKAAIGVIPQQRYVVKASELATVNAAYYSEFGLTGIRQRAGMYSFQESGSGGSHPITLPRKQTEYVSTGTDLGWFGGLAKYSVTGAGGFEAWYGGQRESWHHYRAGQTLTEDWNKFPLHPAGAFSLVDDSSNFTVAPVTRDGDLLRLALTPFSDNQPGHTGMGFHGESRDGIGGSYRLTRDGTTIVEGNAARGSDLRLEQNLDPTPSTLKFELDAYRFGPNYALSTETRTEWTWPSKHVEGATLPGSLVCTFPKGQPPSRACAAEPLLTLGYAVGGLGVGGRAQNGPQSLELTVGHLQSAAASPITGATVQFSLDDGATWQDATTTARGDGRFTAAFAASFPGFDGGYVSLKVIASDAAGAAIAETITRAYKVLS
ncbi:hypothetical protein SAMN05421504_11494 [Amycolatopsis xylanica]|uniref:Uncharacterized protein n=1 Tax=Amycolatopsis xylanica TaxID=589385 RepID=A0A1H3SLK1_9PSEU|nr:hypothetical protein [Amycolatopsis xylanica]SDZ38570.1 hypothetical protein SAMN05421504_11494 [Amycolatopsis xylanica]